MGEQFVASQPPARTSRRAKSADVDRDDGRSWLSHGFAALGISALGLAVAGSVALTTSDLFDIRLSYTAGDSGSDRVFLTSLSCD